MFSSARAIHVIPHKQRIKRLRPVDLTFVSRGVGSKVKPPRPVINRAHPLARGLLVSVPCWEYGATSFELVNNQRGDLVGVTRGVGRLGRAVSFDGADTGRAVDFGNIGDRSGVAPWTMAGWVYLDLAGTSGRTYVIAGRTTASAYSHEAHLAYWQPTNQFFSQRAQAAVADTIFGSTAAATSGIYHVAATYNGSTVTVYLNGRRDGSGSSTRSCTTDEFIIGGKRNLGSGFHNGWSGQIFDIRLWDRVLPPQAIAALYADLWALYRPTSKGKAQVSVPLAATPPKTHELTRPGRRVKPPRPVLNRAHPLARGLVLALDVGQVGNYPLRDTAYGIQTDFLSDANHIVTSSSAGGRCRHLNAAGSQGWGLPTSATWLDFGTRGKPMSFECWFRINTGPSQFEFLLGRHAGVSPYTGYSIILNYSSVAYWTSGNGNWRASSALSANAWTHVVVTADASAASFYVNGKTDNSFAGNHMPAAQAGLRSHVLGPAYADPGQACDSADVGVVRLWERVLARQEITSLYTDPWSMYYPGSSKKARRRESESGLLNNPFFFNRFVLGRK